MEFFYKEHFFDQKISLKIWLKKKYIFSCFIGTHTGKTATAESTGTPTSAHAQPMFTQTENRAGFYIRERTGS